MKARNKFFFGSALIFSVIIAFSIQELQEKTIFFYTPEEILVSPEKFENKTIRIGALVQKGSVVWNAEEIQLSFNITDNGKEFIPVFFTGTKPDLFREGQGVVIEGKMKEKKFEAHQLLVKHSEEYKAGENHNKNKETYYKSIQFE
tara:strand:+ start:816 stop:1253 length:438 start_codon:yes stop_codon:yes gene_type:complete